MSRHQDHPVNGYADLMVGDAQLVDVREPHEVAQGTLPAAINIPLGDLGKRLDELDAGRRVVLLCRSGARSAAAAKFLTKSGFGDVFNLTGGMLAFAAHG